MRIFFAFFIIMGTWLQPACNLTPNGETIELKQFRLKEITANHQHDASGKMIIFCMRTDCPFCREQTKELLTLARTDTNTQINIIARDGESKLKLYVEEYQIEQYKNVILSQDTTGKIFERLNVQGLPFIAVITPKKRITAKGSGIVSAEKLSRLLLQ
jgi:hypothetical protein